MGTRADARKRKEEQGQAFFTSPSACMNYTLFCMTEGEMNEAERKRLADGILEDLEFDGWKVSR